jgi:hypothetical protein
MAITITTLPQDYTTASNPVVFEFSSTQTAQDGFSFLVELTVNGSVHSFHQVFPESSNFGKFDCSAILRTIVYSDLVSDGSLSTPYTNAIATYSIRVIDKYGTPPIEVGSWTGLGSDLTVTNGSLRHADWLNYDFTIYDIASVTDPLFLSLFPRTSKYYCGLTESMFVGTLMTTGLASDLVVQLYDITGSTIAISIPVALTASDMLVTDISPVSIVANTSITDANFSTCYYYKVYISQGLSSTESFEIYIDTECSQYTSRRLHWLNKLGVWDSYSFTKYSEEATSVKTFDYQKNQGVWSATNTFDYGLVNGSSFSGTKTASDTMTVNMDWIKEEKHNWLMRSLLESPSVYLEITQGVFEPVRVSTKKYTLKQKIKEGLIQEEIKLSRTYTYTSQLS